MKEIKNSYLMWIGSEHYPTITDWTTEAISHGISKRLPGISVARKLKEPGSVIFVVHDEGEYDHCPDCFDQIQCPECRKTEQAMIKLEAEIADLIKRFDGDRDLFEAGASGMQKRSLTNREKKLEELGQKWDNCELCHGERYIPAGTGGHVKFKKSNPAAPDHTRKEMDYRSYNYWLHQPSKFNADDIEEKHMCPRCGGTGKLPKAKIFGMFIPTDIEYILAGDETLDELNKLHGITKIEYKKINDEVRRGCGYRRTRALYAVTTKEGNPALVEKAIAELIDKGLVKADAVDIKGSFVRFIESIPVDVKRFRGIKSWSLDPAAEEEAEDIFDAISDGE